MANEAGFGIFGGKGFHIVFENGWTVSVQFGPGNYCEHYNSDLPYDAPKKTEEWSSRNAEIAAWDADHNWYKFPDDSVKGYCDVPEVLKFINKISRKKSGGLDEQR